ncbi:DUF4864 domain-containing protein [Dongia sp.]|uniref:DUF4864 domain-containing protein n=1 Tax=Dongia sp. TaxID=1977262 RepID=UPI0035B4A23D
MKRWVLTVLFLAVTMSSGLRADSSDQAAAHEIIRAQMQAFQTDDANVAFAFASPELQTKFGSPAVFMDMVKSGYAPVYRPRAVEFRDWVDSPGGPEQQVFVIGPDGRGYIAHYMMERQPDGSWRISGCYLEPLGEESV